MSGLDIFGQILNLGLGVVRSGNAVEAADRARSRSNATSLYGNAEWLARRALGRDSTAVDYEKEGGVYDLTLPDAQAADASGSLYDRLAQERALAELTRRSQEGLLGEEERSLYDLNRMAGQELGSQYGALQNRMDAQGLGGGAMGRMMGQAQQQQGANRGAAIYRQGLADAQDRAAQAQRDRAGLASRMRTQSFDEARRRAEAADAVKRNNAGYLRDVNNRDTNRSNQTNESRSADQREAFEDRDAWLRQDVDRGRYLENERRQNDARRDAAHSQAASWGTSATAGFAQAGLEDDEDDDE